MEQGTALPRGELLPRVGLEARPRGVHRRADVGLARRLDGGECLLGGGVDDLQPPARRRLPPLAGDEQLGAHLAPRERGAALLHGGGLRRAWPWAASALALLGWTAASTLWSAHASPRPFSLHFSAGVRLTLLPILVLSQTVPTVVLAPFLAILLGFGVLAGPVAAT